jgi:acylphosphatase
MLRKVPDTRQSAEVRRRRALEVRRGAAEADNEVDGPLSTSYKIMVRRHLTIQGQVQGVVFRGTLQEEAGRQEVQGWCRNCPDGSVEAVLEGEEAAVQKVIAWCHKGPPAARVTRVEVFEEPYKNEFTSFQIRF